MGTEVPYSSVSLNTGQIDAQNMVANRFDLMQTAANEFAASAIGLQESLVNSLADLKASDVPDPDITIPKPSPIVSTSSKPGILPAMPSPPNVMAITAPGKTVIQDSKYTAPSKPSIKGVVAPTGNFPAGPSAVNVAVPTYTALPQPLPPTSPALISVTLPDAPDLTFPVAPILTSLKFPSSPGLSTISFDGETPDSSDIVPPDSFTYNMTVFQESDLWIEVKDKLKDDISNGTTGLDPEIEAAIYQRHKDRQQAENDTLYRDTENMYGASGFNLPTGAMVARLSEIKAEIARKRDGISLDVAINQADLAQKNAQFSMEKGIQVGGLLYEFYQQSEDLTFRIATETAAKAIEIYNTQVAFFNLKLDKYRTDAAVYASRLQGELTKLEAYKTEVSAISVKSDVQKNEVDIYVAQLASLDTQAKIYTSRLEGTKVELGLENLKVETFKSLVSAYAEQINAGKINVEAYKAQIDAENAKVQQYAVQVDAYRGAVAAETARLQSLVDTERLGLQASGLDVEMFKANIQAAIADVQAQAQIAGAQSDISRSESANYAALVGATSEVSRAEAANYSAIVSGITENYKNSTTQFLGEVQAKQDENRTLIAEMSATVQYASALIDGYMKKMSVISESYTAVKGLQVRGVEGAMNTSAQLAASAMNAVNATASYGFDGSSRVSSSHSESMGLSENHSFQYGE